MTYCQSKPKNIDMAVTSKLIQAYQIYKVTRKKNRRNFFFFLVLGNDRVQLSLPRQSHKIWKKERERMQEFWTMKVQEEEEEEKNAKEKYFLTWGPLY